jgi:hypothetical protein
MLPANRGRSMRVQCTMNVITLTLPVRVMVAKLCCPTGYCATVTSMPCTLPAASV